MLINGIEIDLAKLEKPLLLVSEDEEFLFLRLFYRKSLGVNVIRFH